jgi:nucleoside phosphorylase
VTQYREPPEQACRTLLHLLAHEADDVKRGVLIADYFHKVAQMSPGDRQPFDHALLRVLDGRGVGSLAELTPVAGPGGQRQVDAAIVTIVETEWRAVEAVFGINRRDYKRGRRGRRYFEFELPSKVRPEPLRVVATASTAQHNIPADSTVWLLRERYETKAVFLVGIAGGDKDEVRLGDVVIPRQVFYYEPGRSTEHGFQPRPAHPATPDALWPSLFHFNPSAVGFEAAAADFSKTLPQRHRPQDFPDDFAPRVHKEDESIACGEKLLVDGSLKYLRDRFDERLIACDEESYGFADGAAELQWAVFRGISDFGEPERFKGWQYLAAACASLCLRDYLIDEFAAPEF